MFTQSASSSSALQDALSSYEQHMPDNEDNKNSLAELFGSKNNTEEETDSSYDDYDSEYSDDYTSDYPEDYTSDYSEDYTSTDETEETSDLLDTFQNELSQE